ncbi:MAG: S8 family peptidase [Bdellovibrionota bacterium]
MTSSFQKITLFAIFLCSFNVRSEEFLVERHPSVNLEALSTQTGLKVLRSFEAFGKSYDVIEANSLASFSTPTTETLSKRLWKNIETNAVYTLQMGSKKPSNPGDLSDFDPTPVVPNDTLFTSLWGMLNFGQTVEYRGQRHMDSGIAQAWTLHRGSRTNIVAVLDSGVDYNHPDLRANLWTGDVNGQTSFGYDTIDNDHDPYDLNGHGTHVSGTIGAIGNNGIGVAGVNWSTRMMMVRAFNANGAASSDSIVRGLDWIYRHRDNVRVINHSWSGRTYSRAVFEAMKSLDDEGIINVIAAGNDSTKLESSAGSNGGFTAYPAMYPLEHSIVVASYGNTGQRSLFSNYGPSVVDIAAPGEAIYSTYPGNTYKSMQGTSMATPHVTGAVALLMSYRPDLSVRQVKDFILNYADQTQSLTSTSEKGRRLNVYRALVGH